VPGGEEGCRTISPAAWSESVSRTVATAPDPPVLARGLGS